MIRVNQQRITPEPSNFFDGIGTVQTNSQVAPGQPVRTMQSGLQIFSGPGESGAQGQYRQQNPSQQNIQIQQRGTSPNRTRFDQTQDNRSNIASFDRNAVLRRPASQVPTTSRGFNNTPDLLSNQPPRPLQPLQQQPSLAQTNQFGQTQSTYQFSQSGLHFGGISRDALRENIAKKGQLITELTNNRNFFKDELERKNNEFKEFIRSELKKNVYDKVLKANLHYIYKHYENLKTSVNRDETVRILNTNLAKQQNEMTEIRRGIGQLEGASKALEERLLGVVNQPGVIKAQPTIVENITREDMERKVEELKRENGEMERAVEALRKKKEKELYDLKMKHENKGRAVMEGRALRLALQYVDPQDQEQMALKTRVEDLLRMIEINDANRKGNQAYQLSKRKEKLERELEVLKFYSS